MAVKIYLGSLDQQLAALFSYPNIPGTTEPLADTILHWFRYTLDRDGVGKEAKASIQIDGSHYSLILDGPASLDKVFAIYQERLPKLLASGLTALTKSIPLIKEKGLWDPKKDGWRFFLPLGLPMANQRSVQLFHYPPIKLLNPLRDYLNDPVPVRWGELLEANGIKGDPEAYLLETVIDSAPVAASDDQGEFISPMLTPDDYFEQYQRDLLPLLLNPAPQGRGFTVPLIVLGGPAREVFTTLTGVKLGVNQTAIVELVPGLKTAALAANHPYYFYAQAQGFTTVGSGKMLPDGCPKARPIMLADLISARWQVLMAENPTEDPKAVLDKCIAYWNDKERAETVCAFVQRHGSLYYEGGDPSKFRYLLSLEEGKKFCKEHDNNPCAGL